MSEGGHVNASVIFNIATSTTPGVVRTYNRSWEAPSRSLSVRYGNELVIIGCGIEVHMFDTDTDDLLGYCSSLCDGIAVMEKEAVGVSCSGMGYCSISFRRTTRAFRFTVIQIEDEAVQMPSFDEP